MEHCPPRAQRRRIPAFHPVPVGKRRDGWTPARQADFIGMLYQTRSVSAAARAVGMGRESAYRLRKRAGAAGFAAAWDAALGLPHAPVSLIGAKSTGLHANYRAQAGLLQVLLHRGRYVGMAQKPDDSAVIQQLGQLYRAIRGREWAA